MTDDVVLRVLSLCVVLACTETLHGIARTVLVVPRLGEPRALRLSAFTGSARGCAAWSADAATARRAGGASSGLV